MPASEAKIWLEPENEFARGHRLGVLAEFASAVDAVECAACVPPRPGPALRRGLLIRESVLRPGWNVRT